VQAIASAAQDTGPATDYSRFYAAVARAQLTHWLAELAPPRGEWGDGQSPHAGGHRGVAPRGQAGLAELKTGPFILDISGSGTRAAEVAEVAAAAGHAVLRVAAPGAPAPPAAGAETAGRLLTVTADGGGLEFLADGCAGGVIAEDRTLSRQLAAETLVGEIARVLRPGGLVLACVDSLNLGMAVLAEQHRWLHLIDVPNADVVLVPWPDGTITRCYGAEQLRELFTGGGLEVNWIRPRTVFSPRTVSYLLARDQRNFGRLVTAELSARADDSVGAQLIICAVKTEPFSS